MANDLHALAVDLGRLASALGGEAMKDVMTTLGVEAKKDATTAASRDLGGDPRFSRWAKAGDLAVRFDHVGPGAIEITPTPRTRGPWKVAEFGRQAGMSRGRTGGKRRRGKNGIVTTSTASAPRKVGATRAKDTFTDACDLIVRETPERALNELHKVARGIVGG